MDQYIVLWLTLSLWRVIGLNFDPLASHTTVAGSIQSRGLKGRGIASREIIRDSEVPEGPICGKSFLKHMEVGMKRVIIIINKTSFNHAPNKPVTASVSTI